MSATNKVSSHLQVSPHVRARGQALAVVRDESLSEVYRIALEGMGLSAMERSEAGRLQRLGEALRRMGIPFEKGVDEMMKASPRIRLHELFAGGDVMAVPLDRFPYRGVTVP